MKYEPYYRGKNDKRPFIMDTEGHVFFEDVFFEPAPMVAKVKIKRLHPDAVVPKYATPGSAGFDLVAIEDVIIEPGKTKLVRTGLAFEIPDGFEMQIRPRSGISLKTPLRIANSPGTIDSDFRGEVGIIVWNGAQKEYYNQIGSGYTFDKIACSANLLDGSEVFTKNEYLVGAYIIRKGDRIAQGIIAPVVRAQFEVVDELSEAERGAGAFGSTGTKTE
jgi:dUTP pyrophosphatase